MKGKSAKKLRRLAKLMSVGKPHQLETIYKRLKATHKTNKGEI